LFALILASRKAEVRELYARRGQVETNPDCKPFPTKPIAPTVFFCLDDNTFFHFTFQPREKQKSVNSARDEEKTKQAQTVSPVQLFPIETPVSRSFFSI
jgi:hypothetical protein